MRRWRPWLILLTLWAVVGLACNLPLDVSNPAPPPPTRLPVTIVPGATLLVATPSPTLPFLPAVTDGPNITPLPTFTPIQPVLAATITPRGSEAPAPTVTPRSSAPSPTPEATTPAPPISSGPLGLSYRLQWRVEAGKAIASVTLSASGGVPPYTFFHDDLPVAGSEFEYAWTTCNPNPGSFRVDSADGQTTRVNYYETPPCPP